MHMHTRGEVYEVDLLLKLGLRSDLLLISVYVG